MEIVLQVDVSGDKQKISSSVCCTQTEVYRLRNFVMKKELWRYIPNFVIDKWLAAHETTYFSKIFQYVMSCTSGHGQKPVWFLLP